MAGRDFVDDICLYVLLKIPKISNQKLLLGHIVSEAATELSYNNRSFFMKEVTTENIWTFEVGVGDGVDIPI